MSHIYKSKAGGDQRTINQHLHRLGYKLGKGIGEGSYCKVKIALAKNKKVACKIIDKRRASPEFLAKFLPRELEIARALEHPHVVRVLDVLELGGSVLIFMDYCEGGDLLEFIRERGALGEGRARRLFGQVLSAVTYLHSLDIAHRDLKCENILLHTPDYCKISDFGFARRVRGSSTSVVGGLVGDAGGDEGGRGRARARRVLSETFCGSAAYAAPEILLGVPYNPTMYDSWSLGCVLFIMLTATMPFDDSNVTLMLRAQQQGRINFPDDVIGFDNEDGDCDHHHPHHFGHHHDHSHHSGHSNHHGGEYDHSTHQSDYDHSNHSNGHKNHHSGEYDHSNDHSNHSDNSNGHKNHYSNVYDHSNHSNDHSTHRRDHSNHRNGRKNHHNYDHGNQNYYNHSSDYYHSSNHSSNHKLVLSTSARNLIRHLLEADVTKRATIAQAHKSKWMMMSSSTSSVMRNNSCSCHGDTSTSMKNIGDRRCDRSGDRSCDRSGDRGTSMSNCHCCVCNCNNCCSTTSRH